MSTQAIIEREQEAGSVSWDQTQVAWSNPSGQDVVVDLNQVIAIGEYTTDAGPWFDDWFLVFLYSSGEWGSLSIYADGIDELKQFLSERYHFNFSGYSLTGSTQWKSIVRYPVALEGLALFDLVPPKGYKSPDTLLLKLMCTLGLGAYRKSWTLELTAEIRTHFNLTAS